RLGPDWVWPYWLERQLDPASPAFVPRGHLPALTNVTHRNWTMVGNVGSDREAIVDPRGLVTPWFDGWSLDWWVGADDRWHFPSREVSVRQRLVDDAPVVETVMRVPGGDAVERVYAVQEQEELVVVEFETASSLTSGLAQAAFLFPLAHQTTLRVAIPLVAERRTRRRRLARRRVQRMPELPAALPSSAAVARAWALQGRRGLRVEVPDARLASAVEAN